MNYQCCRVIKAIIGHRKVVQRLYATDKSTLNAHKEAIMRKGLPIKKPINGVKHVILVSSGKGGVGKSTVSVNLAVALKLLQPARNIGLLDVDVFGPSIPLLMNLHDTPLLNEKNLMVPLVNYGVKCMSMGFLMEEGAPVIWRGLMVMQALEKLLRQVDWTSIDFLIVDTPPGTGDTHLSLIQNIPISGVLIVTTPHRASLEVSKRGAVMYQKLNVPILGLVENMSSVTCPSCSQQIKILGDGTSALATDINAKVLQSFPLDDATGHCAESGTPIPVKLPESEIARKYFELAQQVVGFF